MAAVAERSPNGMSVKKGPQAQLKWQLLGSPEDVQRTVLVHRPHAPRGLMSNLGFSGKKCYSSGG